jgi:hypothetical protein
MLIHGLSLKNSEWIETFFEIFNRNSSKELAIFFVIYICSALLFIYPYFLELEGEFLTAVKVEEDFQLQLLGSQGGGSMKPQKKLAAN